MSDFTPKEVVTPETEAHDPLTGILRVGSRALISQAVELELSLLLEQHSDKRLEDGRQAVVRNAYFLERTFNVLFITQRLIVE